MTLCSPERAQSAHEIGVRDARERAEAVTPTVMRTARTRGFYPVYDEGWREVARYRAGDASPKEQFVKCHGGA